MSEMVGWAVSFLVQPLSRRTMLPDRTHKKHWSHNLIFASHMGQGKEVWDIDSGTQSLGVCLGFYWAESLTFGLHEASSSVA